MHHVLSHITTTGGKKYSSRCGLLNPDAKKAIQMFRITLGFFDEFKVTFFYVQIGANHQLERMYLTPFNSVSPCQTILAKIMAAG